MYTDPKIVATEHSGARVYVKVMIAGKRHRFYNGKAIGLHLYPNRSQNWTE